MSRLIFVCRTCDRNARIDPGDRSAGISLGCRIREYLQSHDGRGLIVREVACLNGCLKPCNAALRGAGRFTYRFSRLSEADVADIIAFGQRYWKAREGYVDAARIPAALRAKMTVCTPPPGRWQ